MNDDVLNVTIIQRKIVSFPLVQSKENLFLLGCVQTHRHDSH